MSPQRKQTPGQPPDSGRRGACHAALALHPPLLFPHRHHQSAPDDAAGAADLGLLLHQSRLARAATAHRPERPAAPGKDHHPLGWLDTWESLGRAHHDGPFPVRRYLERHPANGGRPRMAKAQRRRQPLRFSVCAGQLPLL